MKAEDVREHIHNIAFWSFLVMCFVTGYTSFEGVLALSFNFTMAFCYAIAVGTMIFLLATANMKIIPILSENNRHFQVWFGLILSACIAVGSSSYTSISGIAGEAVVTLEVRNHIESVQKIISKTSLSVKKSQSVVTSLKADHQRYVELADTEIKSGTISGSKGAGAVSGMYMQAANIMFSASSALDNSKAEITSTLKTANELIEKMRFVLDEDAPINDRVRSISKLNRKLQSEYEKLASISLGRVITSSISPIDSVIAVATSDNRSLRKKQEAVIAHIKDEFLKTKQAYIEIATSPDITIPEYPTWEATLRTKLILKHAGDILPYIIGAIALDCAPFLLISFLIPLERQIRIEIEANERVDPSIPLKTFEEMAKVLNEIKKA